MPRITDDSRIRALLDRDRAWAAYAIGDLSPDFAPHCTWYAPADEAQALLLLYGGFAPPIVFAMGSPSDLAPLFREIDAPVVSLHVQPDALAAMAPAYRPTHTRAMCRMAIEPASFQAVPKDDVVALDQSHHDAVVALYDDGHRHGDGPAFFHAWMLGQGTFRGVWDGADLVAVGGTHLFSRALGICAVGNVYTRRDRRGQGLGARVTSAVVQHALSQSIPTIVLNVGRDNAGARRVYGRLGFRDHCEFFEGEAEARIRG
ncbi:MAG: GNAT family N-acetyltransferase [Acidobacteriota bacterium]